MPEPRISLTVREDDAGIRLDHWLAGKEEVGRSRSQIQKLITEQKVRVNGQPCKASLRLQVGDKVDVELPRDNETPVLEPEPIPLDIIYEDDDLFVIDKPAGLVVHPGPGNTTGTLVHALLHRTTKLAKRDDAMRPGIVHRLDKDTSGLLVVARTEQAYEALTEQLKERTMLREYAAIVCGRPEVERGTIDAPIGRDPVHRQRQAVVPDAGRPAVTYFELAERFRDHALLYVRLETGRTHQIRVHLRFINLPVLGDPIYGTRKNRYGLRRQALHARRIRFRHPDGRWLEFHSQFPSDMQRVLDALRADNDSLE